MSVIHELASPLPGTFYRSPAPDAPPFKAEGERVEVGEVLGLIEVMKQFSEITAEASGRVQRFLVGNADPVEPGQVLLLIEAD